LAAYHTDDVTIIRLSPLTRVYDYYTAHTRVHLIIYIYVVYVNVCMCLCAYLYIYIYIYIYAARFNHLTPTKRLRLTVFKMYVYATTKYSYLHQLKRRGTPYVDHPVHCKHIAVKTSVWTGPGTRHGRPQTSNSRFFRLDEFIFIAYVGTFNVRPPSTICLSANIYSPGTRGVYVPNVKLRNRGWRVWY